MCKSINKVKGQKMKKQAGFTLIELAIVLVIIGLLLGGVLRGQELINSARVKSLIRDFQNVQVFLYGYQDRFRALPGDDAGVANRGFGGTLSANGPVGNGQINGVWNGNVAADEATLFWEHVRLAGFAPGPTVPGAVGFLPTNANGGFIGIQSLAGFAQINDGNFRGSFVICSAGIIGRDAIDIDTQIDDGITNTGNVRANVAAGPSLANAAIIPATPHTVCMTI
jgi:prepilin-type N-terminal cleavage/methylation domain-containing protein